MKNEINVRQAGLALYSMAPKIVAALVFVALLLWVRHLSIVFFNAAMMSITTSIMVGTGRHLANFKNPENKVETKFYNQVFLAFTVTGLVTLFICILTYWDNWQVDQRWSEFVYIYTLPSLLLYVCNATIAHMVTWFTENKHDRDYVDLAGGLLAIVGGLLLVAVILNSLM